MKSFLKEYGLTEPQLRRILGGITNKPQVIKTAITDNEFEFAIISDTHLCSRYEALDELHTFYAICKKVGITHVIHCGDLLDGGMTHPGWENEIHTFGADRQVAYAAKRYPKVRGITTYFIGGSHDYSFYKRSGAEIGYRLQTLRHDLVFLGRVQGNIELREVKVRMTHPAGGMPYAKSYRGQKIAESIASGDKPDILAIGHLHISMYFHYRNMHIFQTGCFQRQTPYLMEKALNPDVGGWTVNIRIADDEHRSIVSMTPTWIPFF